MKSSKILSIFFLVAVVAFASCTTPGPSGLFGKRSAHEAYGDKLKDAGLDVTALGRKWFAAAEQSFVNPVQVKIPYKETGYFAADEPRAVGVKFSARRGEKITIGLSKKPTTAFAIFLDLWQPASGNNTSPKLISAADTSDASLVYEVKQEGFYLVRLQPELLKSGEYTLSITNGPSLEFPVSAKAKSNIGSFWGAGRDGGARKHEGIDIFAAKRTPLVAAADGVVGAVNENNLGGKVVWLRPKGKDYNLYYAHLDEQLVQPGQSVKAGDVLGLMGNSGNAKTTSPHLHFGIYTNTGAVDPLPFVQQNTKEPANITAPLRHLDSKMKTTKSVVVQSNADGTGSSKNIQPNTLVTVIGAAENKYKILLPDGATGFVPANAVAEILKPMRSVKVKEARQLLDAPDNSAPKKLTIEAGESVAVLASFGDYFFIKANDEEGWLHKQSL